MHRWMLALSILAVVAGRPSSAAAEAVETIYWGAIAFTADGSYNAAWRMPSKAEAEAKVAVACAKFGRGECRVVSFSAEICVGLATYQGSHSRKRWSISHTSGGFDVEEAKRAALKKCNADKDTRGCKIRTAVCADGRA